MRSGSLPAAVTWTSLPPMADLHTKLARAAPFDHSTHRSTQRLSTGRLSTGQKGADSHFASSRLRFFG